jgi:hypothetical protein
MRSALWSLPSMIVISSRRFVQKMAALFEGAAM